MLTWSVCRYFLLYQVVQGHIRASVGRVAAYVAIWQHGAGFMDNIAVVLTLKNFRYDSGKAVGLLKSFFGLSAAVFSCITSNLLKMNTDSDGDKEPDLTQLFLFLTIGPCALAFLSLPGSRFVDQKVGHSKLNTRENYLINIGYVMVVITTIYVTVVKVLQSVNVVGQSIVLGILTIPFLLIIFSPAGSGWLHWLPGFWNCNGIRPRRTQEKKESDSEAAEPLLHDEDENEATMEDSSMQVSQKSSNLTESMRKNFDAWHALVDANFWLSFVACTCGFGSGLMVINNIGDISKAIDIKDDRYER